MAEKKRKKGMKFHLGFTKEKVPLAGTLVIASPDKYGYKQSPYMRQRRTIHLKPGIRYIVQEAMRGIKIRNESWTPSGEFLSVAKEIGVKMEGDTVIGKRGIIRVLLAYAAKKASEGKSSSEIRSAILASGAV